MTVDAAAVDDAVGRLETGLRTIGLYVESAEVVQTPDGQVAVVVDALVGDLAFVREDVDAELEAITRAENNDRFLDTRNRIARRLAEGKDPFGTDG